MEEGGQIKKEENLTYLSESTISLKNSKTGEEKKTEESARTGERINIGKHLIEISQPIE